MSNRRKRYSPDFKAKAALAAAKKEETTAELTACSGVHHHNDPQLEAHASGQRDCFFR
jgi:transposase-like protein